MLTYTHGIEADWWKGKTKKLALCEVPGKDGLKIWRPAGSSLDQTSKGDCECAKTTTMAMVTVMMVAVMVVVVLMVQRPRGPARRSSGRGGSPCGSYC